MRRSLCYLIAGIALLGIGVGAGILVQRQYQVATVEAVEDNGSGNSFDPRPVRVECLTRRCRSYTATVFISRADDEEDLTHIIVRTVR